MGVSGFSITPDRLEQVSFTIPHSVSQSQVIMLEEHRGQIPPINPPSNHNLAFTDSKT